MTRPKADADPWLTDPIARDKVVAKTVVAGIREIITLLRAIRDEAAETKALRAENQELRAEMSDLWRSMVGISGSSPSRRIDPYERCNIGHCALPDGHPGNHRGSVRSS